MSNRIRLGLSIGVAIAAIAACQPRSPQPTAPFSGVVPPQADVSLGKALRFTSTGPARDVRWWVREGPGHGIVSADGLYRAPFIAPDVPTATIMASTLLGQDSARVVIVPIGPDPDDCRGPAQASLPAPGEYVYAEELPVALVRVPPVYPDSAREAGVDGTVLLDALVCASGQIIEVRVHQSVPMLDAAAVDAVEQWLFQPAKTAGQPIAVWVAIPVRFSLH